MNKREVFALPIGEFNDLLACYFIDTGRASPKKVKKEKSAEEWIFG